MLARSESLDAPTRKINSHSEPQICTKTQLMRKIMTLRRTQLIQTAPLITNQVVSNVPTLAKMILGEGVKTDKSL